MQKRFKTIGISAALLAVVSITLIGCGPTEDPEPELPIPDPPDSTTHVPKVVTPKFNQDSAYKFVEEQVAFGPRVPNTPEHDSCAKYLAKKLKSYGAHVIVQEGEMKAYTGKQLKIQNIIAQYNKESKDRIMFCAHWDSRHMADRDPENKSGAIDGANDGASGVGVLLEMARQMSMQNPKKGVDLILFDAEDYGEPQLAPGIMQLSSLDDTWCLGSQYWAMNPPIAGYKPKYGILLDMVGASDAVFPKEGFSFQYAGGYLQAVWDKAQSLGYGSYFINYQIGGITDDHKYVNEMAGIPTIDIIHYRPNESDFGSFHHTHADKMDIIDAKTLGVVGHVCLEIIYQGL